MKRLLSALRLNEFHLADPGFRRDVGSEVATLVAGGRVHWRNPQIPQHGGSGQVPRVHVCNGNSCMILIKPFSLS